LKPASVDDTLGPDVLAAPSNPGTDGAGIGNLIGQGEFGVITSTFTQPDGTTSARQIQVALKIIF
jgi:hypothetical protein